MSMTLKHIKDQHPRAVYVGHVENLAAIVIVHVDGNGIATSKIVPYHEAVMLSE